MYISQILVFLVFGLSLSDDDQNRWRSHLHDFNKSTKFFIVRAPRVFAVTTTTSLSTFNTQTLCYSQSDPTVPLTACAARRKRMLNARRSNIDNTNDSLDGEINPSNTEEDYDYGLGN